jgi:hypothetical protein
MLRGATANNTAPCTLSPPAHDCSGPVTLAVSTHLAMACPNIVEQEITRSFYYGWYHECVD